MRAIKNRFGGNTGTKKTQKNLLKQQYENVVASSTEVIEQTYERLQKLISQPNMHGEVIPQEDINQEFLRSLLQEWTMHTIVWRNKPEIETLMEQCYVDYEARRIPEEYTEEENWDMAKPQKEIKVDKSKVIVSLAIKRHFAENWSAGTRIQDSRKLWEPTRRTSSLDDFVDVNESVSKSIVKKPTVETNEPKTTRKENGAPILKELGCLKVRGINVCLRKTSVDKNRQNTPSPRGNKRNWNQQMSQKLGSNFEMFNKACHACSSFDHLKNYSNNWDLLNNITAANNSNFTKKVNTVKGTRVNTTRPKAVLSAVKGNKGNAVKASACNPQQDLKDKGLIASGCSRHMIGNRSYLTDYEEINGEFVAFGVFTQMCDKNNSVLFTDTECVVLSLNFKLTDESHVLLKVSRKDNMYSVDLKNVFLKAVLTFVAGNQSNGKVGTKACDYAGKARVETVPGKDYILLPLWTQDLPFSSSLKDSPDAGFKPSGEKENKDAKDPGNKGGNLSEEGERINQEKDARADINNLDTYFQVSHVPTTRIHKDHPLNQVIGDLQLLQFKLQKLDLVELPKETRAIGPNGSSKTKRMKKMDVKSAFLYGKIEEEVYDKYVTEILKKFSFSDVKTTSTPMETHKLLLKDADGEDVDEHLYRSMIGSLMYLTSSRPDIMFAVCACARFQVNPKISHLHAVKRIFRYLKGQPKLGLWYPKDSPFDLVAFTNSDYTGASLDRKPTTGGCQFLGYRLISWQCKKQIVVANSTTKVEYIAASNCCGQVLWIQNQLLDYGYKFMHTKIYIDNESTICIVKNLVFHSKTKHIEIRHHFIMDSNRKKLIQMIKIHTDQNVANLLTKAFDRIIYKGWLQWNAKATKDGIGVKTGNSRVNAVGHYLVLLGKKNVDLAEILDFLNDNPIRQGKDFSRTVTPLFSSMLAQQADMGEGPGQPTNPQHTSTSVQPSNEEPITVPSLSQPKKTHRPRKAKRATEISQYSGPIPLVADETSSLTWRTTKTAQAKKISSLKKRVKKLERKKKSKTPGMNLFKIGTSRRRSLEVVSSPTADMEVNTDSALVTTGGVSVSTAEPIYTDRMRSEKSKVKGVVMKEPTKLEEEERLAREREEDANIAEWDNAQAMMDSDYELAARIQAQEHEELAIEEKSRLFVELMDKRKKHFARLRAEEQRRKPLTKD
ncbi:hypothetical protein Tco_0648591 [Tanacetum coccineum]